MYFPNLFGKRSAIDAGSPDTERARTSLDKRERGEERDKRRRGLLICERPKV
jgi:hypothetical protein